MGVNINTTARDPSLEPRYSRAKNKLFVVFKIVGQKVPNHYPRLGNRMIQIRQRMTLISIVALELRPFPFAGKMQIQGRKMRLLNIVQC